MLYKQIESLLECCRNKGVALRTAESCTAGGLAAAIASVSGASDVLDRGWITYSNQAKMDELGVSVELLNEYGAVSEAVVQAMAEGGVKQGQGAQQDSRYCCIAISGIAGPNGGTEYKPVGTVWMAICISNQDSVSELFHFQGERLAIQQQAVEAAIVFLLRILSTK